MIDLFDKYTKAILEGLEKPSKRDKNMVVPGTKEYEEFEDKLSVAKYKLFRDQPFLGVLLSKLKVVVTNDIPTMAVDDNSNIYINPGFALNELSFKEVLGVLAHETMHVANLTIFRMRGRKPKLWNIATDYIINRDLLESGLALPKLGLIPVRKNGGWFISMPSLGINDLDITDETSEGLYDELEKTTNEIIDALSDMREEFDKHIDTEDSDQQEPEDLNRNAIEGRSVGVESDKDESEKDKGRSGGAEDEKQGQGKKESMAEKEAKIKAKIQDTLTTLERTRSDGSWSIPRSFDKTILKSKTDFKTLLRNFVKRTERSYQWNRPQRKGISSGYYAPRVMAKNTITNIIIAVDTSGSIGDTMLTKFFAEVINIAKTHKNIKMKILFWTASVYLDKDLTAKEALAFNASKLLSLKVEGGGTTFSSIADYLDKTYPKQKFTGIVVLTDGDIEENPRMPNTEHRLFLISPKGITKILKRFGPTFEIDI